MNPFRMKSAILAAILASSLFIDSRAWALSVDEILLLHRTGVSADIIIENLKRAGKVKLTNSELERLRRARVPVAVIEYLMKGKVTSTKAMTEREKAAQFFREIEEKKRSKQEKMESDARRKESERLRQEAERLKLEARKMAETAQAARLRATRLSQEVLNRLRQGFLHLKSKEYGRAASVFYGFLRSGLVPPNSHRYVDGQYGLARSLYDAGLMQAAIPHLVEVLRRGPTTTRFDSAFMLLYRAMGKIDYSHPILALLGTFEKDLGNRPASVKSAFHFLLGEFHQRYDQTQEALRHFTMVAKGTRPYAAAQYQAALLHVRGRKPRTALLHFRAALGAASSGKPEIADLANLALARLAYEVGSYKAAHHHYLKIKRTSRFFWQALYETAWSQVMAQQYGKALGTIHSLSAPNLTHEHMPDRFLLEAAVYLNLCRYEDAKKAVKTFRQIYKPLDELVKKLVSKNLAPARLYETVGTFLGRAGSGGLLKAALRDAADLFRATATAAQVRREIKTASGLLKGAVLKVVLEELDRRKKALTERAGLVLRLRLNELSGELDALEVKATEISLEIDLAEKELLEEQTLRLRRGQAQKEAVKVSRVGKLKVRSDQVSWPFEGEYWLDEIGHYRSRLRSACRPKPSGNP